MSVDPKRLAAVFFIPRTSGDMPLERLLHIAGASEVGLTAVICDSSGLVDCLWAGLYCKGFADNLPQHQVLQIYFWQSSFLELAAQKDNAYPLALAFRDACEALSPDVAFIVTHLDQAQHEWILTKEALVLNKDANALADERLGLLYFNKEIIQHWSHSSLWTDREDVPVNSGRLVFSGLSSTRWF